MKRLITLNLFVLMLLMPSAGCSKQRNKRILYPSKEPPMINATHDPHAAVTMNFDNLTLGQIPAPWHIAETNSAGTPASWAVIAEPTAPSQPNVLSITHTTNVESTFNLAISDIRDYKNLDLSVKIHARTGKEDQGGGLIWRCQDAGNYYVCRWNPLETNFRVYQVVNSKRTQIATADTKADPAKWHTIRATMKGHHIECYLDGEKLLEGSDDNITAAGKIGLWSKADAASEFDDLTVQENE